MKKLLAISTLLMYFVVSTGFVVNFHYCMDKLDSVQIGSSDEDECGKCGMTGDSDCCFDDVKIVKLETSHVVAQATPSFMALSPAIEQASDQLFPAPYIVEKVNSYYQAHGPPDLTTRIYLRNRVFRI